MFSSITVKTMFAGALGAITPYVLFGLLAEFLLPPGEAAGIGEGIGILMTLACLPTICIGALLGAFAVKLVEEYQKPTWIIQRLQEAADPRFILLLAYIVGLLTGPLLAMTILLLYLTSQ